jgi:hypothetical protein
MPRAIAKVGDRTIAETNTWEMVEGNIYVSMLPLLLDHPDSRAVPRLVDQGQEHSPAV